MAAKDKNVQPRVVSPIEVSPRLVEPKFIKYPFGGTPPTPPPSPIDDWWGLKLTMPEGGTISLNKTGSPTVVELEYSLDGGATWMEWTESGNVRSLALNAGQTMHVRNASPTSTGFSTSTSDSYQFSFNADTYASGNIMSLLCSDPSQATMSEHCFRNLFRNCQHLITPADMTGVTIIKGRSCYSMYYGCTSLIVVGDMRDVATIETFGCYSMYQGCTSLISSADMSSVTNVGVYGCGFMYQGCSLLNNVRLGNPDITASGCLSNWLQNVSATGDFYCSSSLTIPTGTGGIPSGWTRRDI